MQEKIDRLEGALNDQPTMMIHQEAAPTHQEMVNAKKGVVVKTRLVSSDLYYIL